MIFYEKVFCFDKEEELIKAWYEFISTVDPDLVIGYNTTNFDFPYLIERAEALGVSVCSLGRIKGMLFYPNFQV